jgi:hypothetical protein
MAQTKQKATTTKSTKKPATQSVTVKKTIRRKKEACDCSAERQMLGQAEERVATMRTAEDLRNAVLIVSLVINLYFLTAWVMLQVTTRYDIAVAELLFSR